MDLRRLSLPTLHWLFPEFAPHSRGGIRARSAATAEAIRHIGAALEGIRPAAKVSQGFSNQISQIPTQSRSNPFFAAFAEYGSDKSDPHDYDRLYSTLFPSFDARSSVTQICEVGIGSTQRSVLSHMPRRYDTGASLFAWKKVFPNAKIVGIDIDVPTAGFGDDFSVYRADQTQVQSLDRISAGVGGGYSLMVDDGLHAPHANLNTLAFFLPRMRVGGFAVIEDIHESVLPLWRAVRNFLPSEFEAEIVEMRQAHCFVVRKAA